MFIHQIIPPKKDLLRTILFSSEILKKGGICDNTLNEELFVPIMKHPSDQHRQMTIEATLSHSPFYNDLLHWCKIGDINFTIFSETIETYQVRINSKRQPYEPLEPMEVFKFFDGYGSLYHPFKLYIQFPDVTDYAHYILKWE